jgi:NAD+ kinase
MSISKIGILYHPKRVTTRLKAEEIVTFLKARGVTAWVCSAWDTVEASKNMQDTGLLLTVGGDGTILRAVQAVMPHMTPITGINQGKLGFMTELGNDEAVSKLPDLISGDSWMDERAMLQAEVTCKGKAPQVFHVLNDIVMARGGVARLVRIEASLDGQPLPTYKADAVIVATATGSTGYALAAGGPVMYPHAPEMLMVPVAPHLCPSYPLLVPEKSTIVLRLDTYLDATLSIDGHINIVLTNGDTVTIRRSPYIARFRRIRPEDSFFTALEEKLKGKQGVSGRKS